MHRAEGFDTGSALPLAKDRRLLGNFGCSKPMPAASDVAIVETSWTVLLDLAKSVPKQKHTLQGRCHAQIALLTAKRP